MATKEERLSRIRRCNGFAGLPCPYYRVNPGAWPNLYGKCYYSREVALAAAFTAYQANDATAIKNALKAALQSPPLDIIDAFLDALSCPAGYWAALTLPNIAAETEAGTDDRATKVAALLLRWRAMLSNAGARSVLVEMVTDGIITADFAQRLAVKLNIPTT